MRNKLLFFIIFCTCLLGGCKRENPKGVQINQVIKQLSIRNIDSKKYFLLIIPNGGCTGCISSAETFVFENLDKIPQLFVIFTSIQSKKMLNFRLGKFAQHPRIIKDEQDVVQKEGLQSIYPIAYFLDNGSLVKIEEISPQNPKNVWQEIRLNAL